jgi:hypothetical protein
MIGFDPIVLVLLGDVPRRRDELVEHARVGTLCVCVSIRLLHGRGRRKDGLRRRVGCRTAAGLLRLMAGRFG